MDYRILDLIIVSAKGLKKASLIGRMDVYAVVSISGNMGKEQKLRTCIHKSGDADPTWNFPMKFIIDEAAGLQNHLTLVVKIKAVWMFGCQINLGEVRVPVKDLLKGVTTEGKALQSVSYQVRRPSGKPKGALQLWYELGEKFTGNTEETIGSYVTTGGHNPVKQLLVDTRSDRERLLSYY